MAGWSGEPASRSIRGADLTHLQRRAEERRALAMTVRVWARSPSPPREAPALLSDQQDGRGGAEGGRDSSPGRQRSVSPASARSSSSERERKRRRKEKKAMRKLERERRRSRGKAESRPVETEPSSEPMHPGPPPAQRAAESEDDEFGPAPLSLLRAEERRVSYGGDLLPGEGAAIATFVQQNLRIPRRGEIGWSGDAIDSLEQKGYVMSGSRHRRMNAVRIRKENQVYSAEEKRALAAISLEERQQRENQIVGDLRALLHQRLQASGALAPAGKAERGGGEKGNSAER